LKKSWVNQVEVGPFIWTVHSLDFEYLMRMSPDLARTRQEVKRFLARQGDILSFFGAARFARNALRRVWMKEAALGSSSSDFL
jgi:hypothetical protein